MEISAKNDDDDEYYEESDENDMEYIMNILPSVIEKLKEYGQVHICKKW